MVSKIRFVPSPLNLRPLKGKGKFVALDMAFAYGEAFERVTAPFLRAHLQDERLALYVDHHLHPAWEAYQAHPRFVLVERKKAPACPELVTEELVMATGAIEQLVAHADFDGAMAAAKWMNGGVAPYPEADNDARAIDSPGRGYVCSARGARIATALSCAHDTMGLSKYFKLLRAVVDAWCADAEPYPLMLAIDDLVAEARRRETALLPLLNNATLSMVDGAPMVCLLEVPESENLGRGDRKMLLRALEERARMGAIVSGDEVTVATFDDDLDLTQVSFLGGSRSIAWGRAPVSALLEALLGLT